MLPLHFLILYNKMDVKKISNGLQVFWHYETLQNFHFSFSMGNICIVLKGSPFKFLNDFPLIIESRKKYIKNIFFQNYPHFERGDSKYCAVSEFLTLYLKYIVFYYEEAEVQKQGIPFIPARYMRTFDVISKVICVLLRKKRRIKKISQCFKTS